MNRQDARCLLVLGMLIAAACGQKKAHKGGGAPPVAGDDASAVAAKEDAGPEATTDHANDELVATWKRAPGSADPAGRHWLAIAHDNTSKTARVHAIDLGDGDKDGTNSKLGNFEAMTQANWPGHYRTLATSDGTRWVWGQSAGTDDDLTYSLVVRSGTTVEREIELGSVEPTGLHLIGDVLFIGSRGAAVQMVDLSAANSPLTDVVRRQHHPSKGYDVFAQSGNYLLAIDDVVMPMYADWFEMTPAGMRRLGDWNMPGVINGHYNAAALLPRSTGHFWLFVTASYGIMSGSGQNLAALDIRGSVLEFSEGLILQNAGPDDRVLEEHEPRDGSQGTPVRLAGNEMTSWTGMAVHGPTEQVLLAAGSRGLMILPAAFDSSTKATLIDLGGPVHDVAVRGDQVIALASGQGKKQSELAAVLVLDVGANKAEVARRIRLPGLYTQLVP